MRARGRTGLRDCQSEGGAQAGIAGSGSAEPCNTSPGRLRPKGQDPGKREIRSSPAGLNGPPVQWLEVGPARESGRQVGQTEAPVCGNGGAVSLAAIWGSRMWWCRIALPPRADVPTMSVEVAKSVGGAMPQRPAGYAVMRYIQQVKRQERSEGLSGGKNCARWAQGDGSRQS